MRKQWLAAGVLAVGLFGVCAQAGELKFSGKVFTDFSFKQNVDDATNATTPDSGTALDLKRFYLTADYTYNDLLSARLRTDIGDKGAKRFDVFVKHAYVQLKFAPELWFRAGAADLPWVPWVEDRYGMRYVENVLIDRVGFGTSADWGLHLGGEVKKGLLAYQVSVVNGRGYGDPSRSQSPTLEARVSSQPVAHLFVGVGGQVGKLGQAAPGVLTPNTASRFNGLVAWSSPRVRLGVNGFLGKNDNAKIVTGKSPEDSAMGVSGFGSVQLFPTLKPTLFARVDYVRPSRDVNPDLEDLYFDAGLEFTPWDPLQVSLVYKRDHVSTGALPGTFSTSNGSIGSASANSGGSYQELGVFTQFVF
jgi:hypothetical protein